MSRADPGKTRIHFESVPKYCDGELFGLFISAPAVQESIRAVEAQRARHQQKARMGLREYLSMLDQIAQVADAAGEVHNIVIDGAMIGGAPHNASSEDIEWYKGMEELARKMTPDLALSAVREFKTLPHPFEAGFDQETASKLVVSYTQTEGALLGVCTYAMFRFGIFQADYHGPMERPRAREYLAQLGLILAMMDEAISAFERDGTFYKQALRERIIVQEQALRVQRALE